MSHFGGGTTDNASDAAKEVCITFDKILNMVKSDANLKDMGSLYGYKRLPMRLGDPFHNANLVVSGASVAAFGNSKRKQCADAKSSSAVDGIPS